MATLKQRSLLFLMATLIGGIIASWQYTTPKSNPKAVGTNEWSLPSLPDPSENLSAYQRLSHYFRASLRPGHGGNRSGTNLQNEPQAWDLQGIVQHNSQRHALIKTGTKVSRYSVGSQLPDASTLVAIDLNGITVASPEGERRIKLHFQQR